MLLIVNAVAAPVAKQETGVLAKEARECPGPAVVFGLIQVVESFADCEVQIVESFEDLRVQLMDSFADEPGEWQLVESFADYTVTFVESFPDFTIRYVESFPGVD